MKKTDNYQEQVYKLIRKDINDDVKDGRKRSHKDYLNKCEEYLNNLCNGWKPGKHRFFSSKNSHEAQEMWPAMKGYFEGIIDVLIQNAKARQMIKQINTISAQSLISSTLKEAGLEFMYEGQQYRAKITVRLSTNNKMVFYINYKKAVQMLPIAIESAREAKALLDKLGNSTCIKKCSGWEKWV